MDYFECFGQYGSDAYCESCPYAYECEQETEESMIYASLGEY